MIRAALVLLLCGLTLLLGLCTTVVQNGNHARAAELSILQRQWEMCETANAQARALTQAHLPGVANLPLDPRRQKGQLAKQRADETLARASSKAVQP
ncbi:MAG TPA: hypothetical protein VM509_11140 [Planctomycetota bacterium]|nr:hypothetical protein [Planctomycetota bacterium]